MEINWTNLSFQNLGFEGIRNLADMRYSIPKGRYEYVDFIRTKSVHADFLKPLVQDYASRHPAEGFVAALAYMLDGSVEYAWREMRNGSVISCGFYHKDFYKICNYINATSNIQCVNSLVMTYQPVGLMLYQEISSENQKVRRFRTIHESVRDDRIDEKEKKALLDIRKRAILKSCTEYLRDLGGIEGLSEGEVQEVIAILDVIKTLDPRAGDLPLKGRNSKKRKKNGGKILKFHDDETAPPK